MTDQPLDLIIAGTAPDEVTVAANQMIALLEGRYEDLVQQAVTFLEPIDEDPVASGLRAFVARLGRINGYRTTVSQWFVMATKDKRQCQQRVKMARIAFDEKLQITLACDPSVQAVEGQQQKLATARNLLRRESRVVAYADRIYTQMLGYHEALKVVHDQLAETKRDLMSQLAVIKQQIALGEVDGNSFPASTPGLGPSDTHYRHQLEAAIVADLPSEEGSVEL